MEADKIVRVSRSSIMEALRRKRSQVSSDIVPSPKRLRSSEVLVGEGSEVRGMPGKGRPQALIRDESPPLEGALALAVVLSIPLMSSSMPTTRRESTVHLEELSASEALRPPRRAPMGTEGVAPVHRA